MMLSKAAACGTRPATWPRCAAWVGRRPGLAQARSPQPCCARKRSRGEGGWCESCKTQQQVGFPGGGREKATQIWSGRLPKAIYLGSAFDERGTADAEVSRRVGLAHVAAQRFFKTVFEPPEVALATKVKVFKLVEDVLFYAVETLPLSDALTAKLEACRMFYLRFVAGWRRDPANPLLLPTNASILAACGLESVAVTLRRRRLLFLGKVVRMDEGRFARSMLFGQLEGTRRVGTQPTTLRSVLHADFRALQPGGVSVGWSLIAKCADAAAWRTLVMNKPADELVRLVRPV